MSEHATGLTGTLTRTRFAVDATLRRHDAQLVFGVVTLAYLVIYLLAIGHITAGSGRYDIFIVADPLAKFFRPSLGAFSFEPIARIQLGAVNYLFSLNTILGLIIAALVGLNLAVTYLAWRQPKACGIGSSSAGALAGIPALLSGAACCGPVLLIVVGIQATGVVLTAFEFLLPVAIVLLLGSLLLVGRQVDPDRLHSGSST